MSANLLEVQDLSVSFFTRRGIVRAVDNINFDVREGEAIALVGESGSGKSITCLSILGLVPEPAGRIVGGKILFMGEDLRVKSRREMQQIRGRQICMIPQDATASLNPVLSVGDQLMETLALRLDRDNKRLRDRAAELLERMAITSASERLKSFPHQLSGGMRQRVVAAIAMAQEPKLLIADEPTTALDVTIQAQFLSLLKDIKHDRSISILFVTHDLGIVADLCDRVAVMYAGRIVETAPVQRLFNDPAHPYTKALMQSVPHPGDKPRRLHSIEGQPPDPLDVSAGCRFAPRCPFKMAKCDEYPPDQEISSGHTVACWIYP